MRSQSQLDSLNIVLATAGEAPVSSMDDNAGVEVQMAKNALDEASRDVQAEGWFWNSRTVTYARDAAGNIPIPVNVIEVDSEMNANRYTVRNNMLWDMENATDVFTTDVSLEVVELLEWEDLPQAARQYITIKAARRYADRHVGSSELSRFTRQDEQLSRINLRRLEFRVGDYSMFPNSWGFARRASPGDSI